jgi:hypothetical protein
MKDLFTLLFSKLRKSRGSVTVLAVFGSVLFLGLTAMVTDVGWMYYNQARLQTAVNAGWKGGYDRMMELGPPLDDTKKALIISRVREILKQNGYPDAQLSDIQVTFPQNRGLEVRDSKSVDLFFARTMNFNNASVAANRGNPNGVDGIGVVPLAIPHGVVKDLDRNVYSVERLNDPTFSFASGSEYILKLGSGQPPPTEGTGTPNLNQRAILIPMESGKQNTTRYQTAYGVAYWCLKENDSDTSAIVPVDWLLGYRGGAFLIQCGDYTKPEGKDKYDRLKAKLEAETFVAETNFYTIVGTEAINAILAAVGNNVLSVYNRPAIAVYSSQGTPDPVEVILRDAKIPYGSYNLDRNVAYNPNLNTRLYDGEILSDVLANYNWLHVHHEDFTGWNGGCKYLDKSCYSWENSLGSIRKTSNTDTHLCGSCREYYFGAPGAGWGKTYVNGDCKRYQRLYDNCRDWDQNYRAYTKNSTSDTNLCPACAEFYFYKNKKNWTSPHGSPSMYYDKTKCEIYKNRPTCKAWDAAWDGAGELVKTSVAVNQLCTTCRDFYFYLNSNTWESPKKSAAFVPTNCDNYGRRCAERETYDGTLWRSLVGFSSQICQNDSDRPQCRAVNDSWNLATARGYTDDPAYDRTRKFLDANGNLVQINGSVTLPADSLIITKPNRVQKMKWDVVQKIREHVLAGGFMYAQCFAPETFDMALWQRKVYYDNLTGMNITKTSAYSDCLAFEDFTYTGFPWGITGSVYFSSINSKKTSTFNTNSPFDPRCQNHTTGMNTKTGHCCSFTGSTLKPSQDGVTVLGYLSSYSTVANYLKGVLGTGEFCYTGGHFHDNTQTKRLVLNNILLGAISTKIIDPGDPDDPIIGRHKSNYGVVDPDNYVSGGANDYRDRFMYGFDQPLQLSDRVLPESGNMAGPTDQAVEYRLFGDLLASPGTRIIVPITDVPPEVGVNNTHNASAATIYDLQGQDHPNGIYNPAEYNFGSSVRIIGFAEFEILGPASYTRDGGTIEEGDAGDLGGYQAGQVRGKFVQYIIRPGEVPVN